MLGTPSLRVIDALLDEPAPSISALADRIDRDQSHVTRLVHKLEARDVVTTTPTGKRSAKQVALGASPVAELYRTLAFEQNHIDFTELLTENTLRVAWFLADWTQPATIDSHLSISSRAITEALRTLRERALVRQDGWDYRIADGLEGLVDFARAVVRAEWKYRLAQHPTAASLVWTSPDEALCMTTSENPSLGDAWQPTGTAGFHEYDVQLFLTNQQVWYAGHEPLTPERTVAQSLVHDADVRGVSYALLAGEKVDGFDVDAFESHAAWYGVDAPVTDAVARYLRTGQLVGTVTPSKQEYEALREQYDIVQ